MIDQKELLKLVRQALNEILEESNVMWKNEESHAKIVGHLQGGIIAIDDFIDQKIEKASV